MGQQALRRWLINRIYGERLLDYGTFAGSLGSELAAAGKQVTLWMAPDRLEETCGEAPAEEAADRLHVYGGALSPLFYDDDYFHTIIFNPADGWPLDGSLFPLVQEWERLLAPNGRLLLICPTVQAPEERQTDPGGLTKQVITYFTLLREVEQRFYLKEIEMRQGYFRAVAIKRYRERSRLTAEEWLRLMELGLFKGSISALQEELQQKERELHDLRKEKDELKERVAQYESSFLGRAARWLNQNDPGKQKPGKLQKEARSSQHSENRLTENHREHRSADNPSLEVVPAQPASNRATPEKDTLITPAMVTRTPLNQEGKREALVDKAWHRYLQRLRRLNPHRWVMILSSPTYFQTSLHSRPLQLAAALHAEQIPVVLICEQHSAESPLIPAHSGSTSFELPRDLFERKAHTWLSPEVGAREKVLVITQPDWLAVKLLHMAKMKGWRTVYDAAVDWEALSRWEQLPFYSSEAEHYLLHHADLVTTVTPALQEKIRSFRQDGAVLVVPNGCGVEKGFAETQPTSPTAQKTKKEQVLIGYWGPLGPPWLDWKTLFSVARKRPHWRFELLEAPLQLGGAWSWGNAYIHSIRDRLQRADWPSNITVYRKRSDREGFKLVTRWQGAFYPFGDRMLAQGCDLPSLKQLLCMGIPVVSVGPNPASATFGHAIVHDEAEALATLERLICSETTNHFKNGSTNHVSGSTNDAATTLSGSSNQADAMLQKLENSPSPWTPYLEEMWKRLQPSLSIWNFFSKGEGEG